MNNITDGVAQVPTIKIVFDGKNLKTEYNLADKMYVIALLTLALNMEINNMTGKEGNQPRMVIPMGAVPLPPFPKP